MLQLIHAKAKQLVDLKPLTVLLLLLQGRLEVSTSVVNWIWVFSQELSLQLGVRVLLQLLSCKFAVVKGLLLKIRMLPQRCAQVPLLLDVVSMLQQSEVVRPYRCCLEQARAQHVPVSFNILVQWKLSSQPASRCQARPMLSRKSEALPPRSDAAWRS